MKWKDFFSLPRIISRQENTLLQQEALVTSLKDQIKSFKDWKKEVDAQLTLYSQKISLMEKYFTAKPEKNAIEQQETEEVDVTDDVRIPLVDGMKVMFEGEKPSQASKIKIYGRPKVAK